MKIGVVSDLHLEFGSVELVCDQEVDLLVLAGDVLTAGELYDYSRFPQELDVHNPRLVKAQRYREFLDQVSRDFKQVVYLAGNHEFYHFRWKQTLDVLREECNKYYNNIHFLECNTFDIEDVTVIGGTLWTDFNQGNPLVMYNAEDMMNDYRIIKNDELGFRTLKPQHVLQRHNMTLGYIQLMCDFNRNKKLVVATHHAPSSVSHHPEYSYDDPISWCYYSRLEEFILDHPNIMAWFHGHTHHPHDYQVGTTRVVCNPRGYYGYQTGSVDFEVKVVEI